MRLARLELGDFRTYEQLVADFSPGVNILHGPNGTGKTNLLEAVGYLSSLSSHRVSTDQPLIRHSATSAHIRANIARGSRATRLEADINSGRANCLRVAGTNVRPREMLGILRAVTFSPEDLAIVKGDPAERRRFIDQLLPQRSPRFHAVICDFDRVLRQRTTLLRSISGRSSARASLVDSDSMRSTLEVWDERLAAAAAELLLGRLTLVDELAEPVAQTYRALAPGSEVRVRYSARSLGVDPDGDGLPRDLADLTTLLAGRIAQKRPEEIERGQTLVGPHRDDLELLIDGVPARGYASHGESWSLALSLRLGSFDVLRALESDEAAPVVLLDDVFAELDVSRREYLADIVADAEQAIITVAVDADIPQRLQGRRFTVMRGSVVG